MASSVQPAKEKLIQVIQTLPSNQAVAAIDEITIDLKNTRALVAADNLEETIASVKPSPGLAEGKAASQDALDELNAHAETRMLSASEMAKYVNKQRNWPSETVRKGKLISGHHAGKTFYPAFQINPEHRTPWQWVPPIVEILEDRELNGRDFVLWAASPSARFDGDLPAMHSSDDDFLAKAAGDLAPL